MIFVYMTNCHTTCANLCPDDLKVSIAEVLSDQRKLASDYSQSLNLCAHQLTPLGESSATVQLEIDA